MTTIRIRNPSLNFNAGHFTIFSAHEREDLHGHSFFLSGEFSGPIDDNGLAFDYQIAKQIMRELCASLDEKVLLPKHSPHLVIGEKDGYISATFADETMLFLPRDVLVLPLRNITLEELSRYGLAQLRDNEDLTRLPIRRMTLRVSTGQGQSAATHWGVSPDA
ncbi:MAG: 6-pyruvoyl tetrahydropterin synthase family protein [Gammaproteobacteria bacterium]